MDENLEYNFLMNQLNANNQIRAVLQNYIANALAVVHQQRDLINRLEEQDKQINLRLQAIGSDNKTIVEHSIATGW